MQLTPQKIAAIKALADDERGEPNTRAAAKAKLEQYQREHPQLFTDPDVGLTYEKLREMMNSFDARYSNSPPNPRTQPREDYSKWRFMDMGNWKLTDRGRHTIVVGDQRVTVFKNRTGTFSYSAAPTDSSWGSVTMQHGFDSIRETQEAAWAFLTT